MESQQTWKITKILRGLLNEYAFSGCEPGLVLTCAPPPASLPPITYWELGERARAQLASKITPWSTHCLRAQASGGRGTGRVMSHSGARKAGAALETTEARSLREFEREGWQWDARTSAAAVSECRVSTGENLFGIFLKIDFAELFHT